MEGNIYWFYMCTFSDTTPPHLEQSSPQRYFSHICFLCSIAACVDPLLFSGFLPNWDEPFGLICLGLESLIPIMSTCMFYKQLGEVGGVLQLTNPPTPRANFICIALQKNSQNLFYPAITSIASEWLTTKPLCKHRLSTSARRPPYAHTITHRG